MKFRVLGLVGIMLGVVVSITGRAWAQPSTDTAGPIPRASEQAAVPVPAPAPEPVAAPAPGAAPPAPAPTAEAPSAPAGRKQESSAVVLPKLAPEPQRNFGFGAQIGFYNPNGLSVRFGARAISVELTAGFAPLLVNYESYSARQDNELKFLMPFEVTPQFVIHAVTFKHEMRGNLLLGYRYNTALGHGATLGGELESSIGRKLVLQGLWGITYFPDAIDHLRGDQVPADASFHFPPWFGYGLSVGLLFYP
ncbi:MAG: hypothetical protein ABW061_09455 [Polyangiaceae bacterium]